MEDIEINFSVKKFNTLDIVSLYQILQLRTEVFVVEQNCTYQDLDNKDQDSFHLTIFAENKLVGYSRLLPAGLSYPEPSIGRIATAAKFRGKGFGKKLMSYSIQSCFDIFGACNIRISAQTQVSPFYNSFGFQTHGDAYFEDGIEHIEMIRFY